MAFVILCRCNSKGWVRTMASRPIRNGDRVTIKPQWSDPGDEGVVFTAIEDESSGRFLAIAYELFAGWSLKPQQLLRNDQVELVSKSKSAEPPVDRNDRLSLARWILWNDSNSFDTDDPAEAAREHSLADLQTMYDDMKGEKRKRWAKVGKRFVKVGEPSVKPNKRKMRVAPGLLHGPLGKAVEQVEEALEDVEVLMEETVGGGPDDVRLREMARDLEQVRRTLARLADSGRQLKAAADKEIPIDQLSPELQRTWTRIYPGLDRAIVHENPDGTIVYNAPTDYVQLLRIAPDLTEAEKHTNPDGSVGWNIPSDWRRPEDRRWAKVGKNRFIRKSDEQFKQGDHVHTTTQPGLFEVFRWFPDIGEAIIRPVDWPYPIKPQYRVSGKELTKVE